MITANRLRARGDIRSSNTQTVPVSQEQFQRKIQELTNAYELEKAALLRRINELEQKLQSELEKAQQQPRKK